MTEMSIRTDRPGQLGIYLDRIGNFPVLNTSQATELSELIQAGTKSQERINENSTNIGDIEAALKGQEALSTFVEHNLKLAVHIAMRYTSDRDELFMDLLQEGALALIRAAQGFNPECGTIFSLYAGIAIERAYSAHLIRAAAGPSSMSRGVARQLATTSGVLSEIDDIKGVSAGATEYVAKRLGVGPAKAYQLLSLLPLRVSSALDITDPENSAWFYETPPSDSDTAQEALGDIANKQLWAAVDRLPEDEKVAVMHHFELLCAAATESRAISRLARRGLSMLRHPSMSFMMKDLSLGSDGNDIVLGECVYIGPEPYYSDNRREGVSAMQVCGSCAIRGACLDKALENPEPGIWGGLTETQRTSLRRRNKEDIAG